MGDPQVLERIEAWLTLGLIDEPTAARLRAAEQALVAAPPVRLRSGPDVAAPEVLAYLGGGFLLAAWVWLVDRVAHGFDPPAVAYAAGFVVPALLGFVAAVVARTRGGAVGRSAGPLVLVSGALFGIVGYHVADALRVGDRDITIGIGAAAWVAAAISALRLAPSVPAVVGLVSSIPAFGFLAGQWADRQLYGERAGTTT